MDTGTTTGATPEPELALDLDTEHGWDAGSFLTGLILGATLGAGVALVMAPASGPRTRRRLRRKVRRLGREAAERWDDTRSRARDMLDERRAEFRSRVARARARSHNGDFDHADDD